MRRLFVVGILFIFLLSSCGSLASPLGTTAPVILATTTFLADITRNVTGDHLKVESLLPVGSDPHSYQPVPLDVAKISKSKLLIINGSGYESFLQPLLDNVGGERQIIEASAGLKSRTDALDPHFWLDPNLVIVYVQNIRDGLSKGDPANANVYQSNADAYIAQLKNLDSWINQQVAQIPAEHRLLVTNHESLGYFADRYGFKIVGAVVPNMSSEAAPSAQQMARLIDLIKASKPPVIFLDVSDNPALASQIASETKVRVVTDLHLESLTDGAPTATYIDMMKYNVTQIVNALK